MDDRYLIEPKNLFSLIGQPDAPCIVDVCIDEDHALDPRLIPTSARIPFTDAVNRTDLIGESFCVIVCHKGFKLSQGVAAGLRAQGGTVRYLLGGRAGWAEAGLPMWPCQLDARVGQRASRWALPFDPSPSDIVAAWTIARFIDPAAEWWFVERDQVDLVADRFDAGCLVLAKDLIEIDGFLRDRLAALTQASQSGGIDQMLSGYCKTCDASPKWLERIFPVLDGLWATLDQGDAQ